VPHLRAGLRAFVDDKESVWTRVARDIRDRALLAVGFAGAFRRSGIAAIQYNWVTRTEQGLSVVLRKSKTDQESRGRRVFIPRPGGSNCPVAALGAWLKVSGISEGALFRRLTKSGKVLEESLSANTVATIVKQRAAQIGLDQTSFSGHSLRAGFATSAAVAGVPMWRIKRQTGRVSDRIIERYIREGESGGA